MSDESDNYPRSPYIQDLFIISKLEHQGRPNGEVGVILVNGGQLTKLHRRFPVELLLSLDWSLIAEFRKTSPFHCKVDERQVSWESRNGRKSSQSIWKHGDEDLPRLESRRLIPLKIRVIFTKKHTLQPVCIVNSFPGCMK